ncbi:hypothetical protein AAG570_008968 [Ranatra chinensis]|uniref:Uncharacterized protein n=1 Tax=Ranatra chinensis TaxID=642074 RepID=A0ABD0YT26_9HEMI
MAHKHEVGDDVEENMFRRLDAIFSLSAFYKNKKQETTEIAIKCLTGATTQLSILADGGDARAGLPLMVARGDERTRSLKEAMTGGGGGGRREAACPGGGPAPEVNSSHSMHRRLSLSTNMAQVALATCRHSQGTPNKALDTNAHWAVTEGTGVTPSGGYWPTEAPTATAGRQQVVGAPLPYRSPLRTLFPSHALLFAHSSPLSLS